MKNEEKLNNISSEYCLRSLFAYLEYNHILKLIKYSKKLQNKIGINKQNYKNILTYEYIIRKIIRKSKIINKYSLYQNIFFISIITYAPIIFILAFSSILYFEGSFNENNLKENYNQSYLNIINRINTSLYLLEICIIISYFIIVCFIFNNFYFDNNKLKKIKYTALLIINLIYILFEILIIWKLSLSYKILLNKIPYKIPWFMICDYILISIILLYIIFMIYITYKYIKLAGKCVQEINKTILKNYKNIIINDFDLPNYFHSMNKYKKRKFILANAYKFQYTHSEKNINLINIINDFRIINNLKKLTYNEEEKIPYFLINEFSEVVIFEYNKLFKIAERQFLFRYNIGGFRNDFEKKNKDILNVILNKDINKISIIDRGKIEYIFFSDFETMDDFKVNLIEANNILSYEQDKDMYDEVIEDLYYKE